MRFSIDRIEGNIVVLQSISTKEIITIDIKSLPKKIKENDILLYNGKDYIIDSNEKNKRINKLKEKMRKLKKNQE